MKNKSQYQLNPLTKAFAAALPVVIMATCVPSAQANTLFIQNHWVRDYLDFGQNKGVFKPGATGIKLQGKDGSILSLPDIPMPDFSAAEQQGASASLGGGFGLTVAHNNLVDGSVTRPQFGQSIYKKVDHYSTPNQDVAYLRYNKFVVETTGFEGGADFTMSWEDAKKRYGTAIDENGEEQILIYRVGNGTVNLNTGKDQTNLMGAYNRNFQTAAIYKKIRGWKNGYIADFFNGSSGFTNKATPGDSGSLCIVYDKIQKKWVVFGTTAFLEGNVYAATLFYNDEYKKFTDKWTHKVALNGGTLAFNEKADAYKINGNAEVAFRGNNDQTKNTNDKDLVFTGGGTLRVNRDLDLGSGGLIFADNKKYTVDSYGFDQEGPFSVSSAGINAGAGSVVDWNVSGVKGNNMHQIGAGTVNYNRKQNNQLRIGNGTAVLNAERTFDLVYLANGLGTVKLGHEKALNEDGNMNNLFFSERGGTLDVNGHSLSFKRIAASDDGAIITNTSGNRATIAINNTDGRYAYHGQLKGNLNLTHNYDMAVDGSRVTPKSHLILDGGVDIKGNIEVTNASMTMQGLPTTHAIYHDDRLGGGDPTDRINQIEGRPSKNQPATFEQSDWETKTYKFDTLKLNNAQVDIGRNSLVYGDIDANTSTMNIGGNAKLYIDQYITNNLTTNKDNTEFKFDQKFHEGTSVANDTIYYEGNIKGVSSLFNAHLHSMKASINLDRSHFNGAGVKVTQLLDDGIRLRNGSQLSLGDVVAQGNRGVVHISQDDSSSISLGKLYVKDSLVRVSHANTKINSIMADGSGTIEIAKWTMNEKNSVLNSGSRLVANDLTTQGLTRMGGSIRVINSLAMTSVDPRHSDTGAVVGLGVKKLTLDDTAKVSASFSDDFLATGNYSYDKSYALVATQDGIEDYRRDKSISFKLDGKLPTVSYKQDYKNINFEFKRNPARDISNTVQGIIGNAWKPKYFSLFDAIIEHNEQGGEALLEVAIDSGLSHANKEEGVASLTNTIAKADQMLQEFANNKPIKPMMSPVRQAIDNRVMSLRQVAYRTSPADYQLASMGGDLSMIGRAMDADAAHQSLFVDVGGSLVKDGALHLRTATSSLGYDTILRDTDGSKTVLGAMFTLGDMSNRNEVNNDNGRMYALTGYANKTFSNDVEFQTMLTAGLTSASRQFTPTTIHIGPQSFRDRTYSLVSSNALKVNIPMTAFGDYQVSFKPMLLADLAATYTREGRTAFMKREATKDYAFDLGVGMEWVAQSDKSAWVAQMAVRRNVWNNYDSIGIGLTNSSGYLTYDVDQSHTTEFNAHLTTIQRVTDNLNVEATIGGTSNTDGAKGINGNVRIRYLF